ncbi:MAG: TonB-dependent receptor plug domain-containing protein [Opitutaceae bacterium]
MKLSAFQVSSSKEMEGSAIAVNEQRFARNIVNVLSADEFGPVVDGAVGEFMKFIPGVRMDYTNGDPRLITLDGVPPSNVPISIGGFDVVSTGGGSHLSRQVALDQVSLNNVARLEVNRSPTPDVSGSALAGSVNFVPRSALLLGNWIFRGLGWEGGYRALLIALLALVTLSPLLARFQMPTAEKFARRQKDRGGIFSTSFRFFRLTNHQHTMKRLALLASTLLASSLFAAETSDAEVRARFQDLDTNHDGKLSPEEFKAFPAAARMPDLLLGNWIFRGLGWEGGCRSGAGRNAHERNLPGRRRPGLHRHSRKRLRHFGRTARGAEHRPAQRTLKV